MLDNVLRATCDRCGATTEVSGGPSCKPDAADLTAKNPWWMVFDTFYYTMDSNRNERYPVVLCPECRKSFNGFLSKADA